MTISLTGYDFTVIIKLPLGKSSVILQVLPVPLLTCDPLATVKIYSSVTVTTLKCPFSTIFRPLKFLAVTIPIVIFWDSLINMSSVHSGLSHYNHLRPHASIRIFFILIQILNSTRFASRSIILPRELNHLDSPFLNQLNCSPAVYMNRSLRGFHFGPYKTLT